MVLSVLMVLYLENMLFKTLSIMIKIGLEGWSSLFSTNWGYYSSFVDNIIAHEKSAEYYL